MRTSVYEVKIMKTFMPTALCRLCSSQEETIQHLMAGCPTLVPTDYLDRHNSVASTIHLHLCRAFGIKTTANIRYSLPACG